MYSQNIASSGDPLVDPDYSAWGTEPAGVNYVGLIPYLIKAIQEKDVEIQDLKTRMTNIESQNNNVVG